MFVYIWEQNVILIIFFTDDVIIQRSQSKRITIASYQFGLLPLRIGKYVTIMFILGINKVVK